MRQLYFRKQHLVFSFLVLIFFLSLNSVSAQKPAAAINGLATDPAMKNGIMSFSLLEKNSGSIIATYNPNTSLVPASSLKILTCAYGLKLLGADFKFKTELQTIGAMDAEGTLKGTLILKGYGDPTLGSILTVGSIPLAGVLSEFVSALKAKGIKKIDGQVYGDASFLSSEGIYDTWSWYDLGNYYATGIYGLNIHDNLYKLNFRQTSSGGKPKVADVTPLIPGLTFDSEVVCKGTSDNAYIYGAPGQYALRIRGSIPPGSGNFTIKGSMPEPPLHAAQLMLNALTDAGIQVTGQAVSSLREPMPNGNRTVLYTHLSQKLKDIVNQTLLNSINVNTEAIMRYCGVVSQKSNYSKESVEGFKAFVSKQISDNSGFFICDGSGLSSSNCIPSLGFSRMLQELFQDEKLKDILVAALPIAGQSGTLKNYLKDSPAARNVVAKTGSMDRVRSFSGLITGRTGKEYVFSLIVNNYSCSSSEIKVKIEKFFDQLYLNI